MKQQQRKPAPRKPRKRRPAPESPPGDQAKIVCIFGKRGSGKSTLAKQFIAGKPRVIVFDPLGEYDGTKFESLRELLAYVRGRSRFFAVYRPRDARAEFPWLARIAYEIGSLCLVAEEISWAISPAKMPTEIEILIRYGRHRAVELIGISRRPAEVNRDLTANASAVYVFRTHEPRDLKYFRDIFGSDADRLPGLDPFVPYVWTDSAPPAAP